MVHSYEKCLHVVLLLHNSSRIHARTYISLRAQCSSDVSAPCWCFQATCPSTAASRSTSAACSNRRRPTTLTGRARLARPTHSAPGPTARCSESTTSTLKPATRAERTTEQCKRNYMYVRFLYQFLEYFLSYLRTFATLPHCCVTCMNHTLRAHQGLQRRFVFVAALKRRACATRATSVYASTTTCTTARR